MKQYLLAKYSDIFKWKKQRINLTNPTAENNQIIHNKWNNLLYVYSKKKKKKTKIFSHNYKKQRVSKEINIM